MQKSTIEALKIKLSFAQVSASTAAEVAAHAARKLAEAQTAFHFFESPSVITGRLPDGSRAYRDIQHAIDLLQRARERSEAASREIDEIGKIARDLEAAEAADQRGAA